MGKDVMALLAAPLLFLAPCSSHARDAQAPVPPKEYRELMACRDIGDASARLACFDRGATQLDAATRSREVVITDRATVTSARRGLFGFTAPVGRLLGFGSNDEDEMKEVESKVTRVGHTGDGGWRLVLEDGSIWEQTDTRSFVLSPKIGNGVKITRGALGSFFMAVQGQRGIKMRRVQ